MKYLSLFTGGGGFELGLYRVFPRAQCVGWSEIDPAPIAVIEYRYPSHPFLGDVTTVTAAAVERPDLLFGGFPCQDLSIGNANGKGLDGARSGLVHEAHRLQQAFGCDFVFENVASMKKRDREAITNLLGVEPVLLNAATIHAQNRERLFWASFTIDPLTPRPHKLTLSDILLHSPYCQSFYLSEREMAYMNRPVKNRNPLTGHWGFGLHQDTAKDVGCCLVANLHKGVPYNVVIDRRGIGEPVYRKLTPEEAEMLMGWPARWTEVPMKGRMMSNSRRYKICGNGVHGSVAEHVFRCYYRHQR